MTFHVGQQVVCVDDRLFNCEGKVRPVCLRAVYTIRAVRTFHHGGTEYTGVHLDEIVNEPRPCVLGVVEWYYSPTMFRPVVKTDISIFTAMLNPTPHRENIDA